MAQQVNWLRLRHLCNTSHIKSAQRTVTKDLQAYPVRDVVFAVWWALGTGELWARVIVWVTAGR